MIYITKDDLTADSYERFINESSEDIENTLDKCEARAIALVITYLKGRYDTDVIFGFPIVEDEEEDPVPSTPPMRDELLVDIISKITLYRVFRRNAPRKLPSDVKEDYQWAIDQLSRINSGRVTMELPPAVDESGNVISNSIWGNNTNKDYYI